MKLLKKITASYALNRRMYNLAIAYVLSALVLRFPWLVAWMPADDQAKVFSLADAVRQAAFMVLFFFVKDKSLSGNGSPEKPYKLAK